MPVMSRIVVARTLRLITGIPGRTIEAKTRKK